MPEWMNNAWNWFASDFLVSMNTYATLICALSTAAIAALTVFLWFENRRLRKAGSSPEVVAYLISHPDGNGAINFVLANVGRGPAFEVVFELHYDEADFAAHNAMLFNDLERMPTTVLPQNEEVRCLLGVGFQLYGTVNGQTFEPLKPFDVQISYRDSFGKRSVRTRRLDIRQFAGLKGILEKSNARKMVESLEKIENHLGRIAKQSARLSGFVDTTELKDAMIQKTKGKL